MTQPTPTRRRPSSMLRSLQQEVNDLFGDFFGSWDEEPGTMARVWAPRADISETDDAYRIKMDLPGVSKDEVEISVEGHRLVIQGERREEKREEGENYLRVERVQGGFYRSLPLPEVANLDETRAEFDNGMLTIHVPKAEERKPKKISIS